MDMITNLYNWLWWGGDPDEKNPISGMSRRDVYNVRKSWAKIYANAFGGGFLIFTRLFQADPESKAMFKYVADASEEEMAHNASFRGHIIYIMAALNTAVENLPQPDVVVPIMVKLGHSHNRIHVKRRQFMVLREVLVNILENDLHFSDDVISSWGLFIAFMYQHIFTIIKE